MTKFQGPEDQGGTTERQEDEINLIDLWLVLMQRKWLILAIFVLCVLAGTVYWQMQTTSQRLQTTLEIGTYFTEDGEETRSIEEREALAARLREAIWPDLRQELARELGIAPNELPEADVSVLEEDSPGGFVFVSSQTGEQGMEQARDIHHKLVNTVLEQHQERLQPRKERFDTRIESLRLDMEELQEDKESSRQNLAHELERAKADLEELKEQEEIRQIRLTNALEEAQSELDELKDHKESRKEQLRHSLKAAQEQLEKATETRERIKSRLERLDTRQAYLERRKEELQQIYHAVKPVELSGMENFAGDSDLAMGMLLRGSLSADMEQELARVREELNLGLQERRLELQARLEDNLRRINEAQRQINERQTELNQFDNEIERRIKAQERLIKEKQVDMDQFEAKFERRIREKVQAVEEKEFRLDRLESDFQRELQRKQQEIRALESQAQEFQPTNALAVAVPYEQIGRGGSLILSLSGVLGLMLGVFGAFLAEFNSKAMQVARERKKQQ